MEPFSPETWMTTAEAEERLRRGEIPPGPFEARPDGKGGALLRLTPAPSLPSEVKAWLASASKFGRKLVKGKASAHDLLSFYAQMPDGVREALGDKFPFLVGTEYKDMIEKLRYADWLVHGPETPELSQWRAAVEVLAKKTGADVRFLAKIQSAHLQIRNELNGGARADDALLKAFDDFHIGMLRIEDTRTEGLRSLDDRLKLAARRADRSSLKFISRVTKEWSKQPILPCRFKLKDFQLGAIQEFLLNNWEHIDGWEPRHGLCQFTRKALWQCCQARLDPREHLPPFTESAVEQARKRLRLKRVPQRRLLVESAANVLDRYGKPTLGQIELTLKGGQTINLRLSTP